MAAVDTLLLRAVGFLAPACRICATRFPGAKDATPSPQQCPCAQDKLIKKLQGVVGSQAERARTDASCQTPVIQVPQCCATACQTEAQGPPSSCAVMHDRGTSPCEDLTRQVPSLLHVW